MIVYTENIDLEIDQVLYNFPNIKSDRSLSSLERLLLLRSLMLEHLVVEEETVVDMPESTVNKTLGKVQKQRTTAIAIPIS